MRALFPLVVAVAAAMPATALAWGDCDLAIGRGWPPAVGNYGEAVEHLFNGDAQPVLSMVVLPSHGEESGVALFVTNGSDWTLRAGKADERVYAWVSDETGGHRELRTQQTPDVYQAPIPAELAQRLVSAWNSALAGMAPNDQSAPVLDRGAVSFVVNGARFSSAMPKCGGGELMMKQAELLMEAAADKEKKREKRWEKIEASLDELQQALAGDAG